MRKIKFRVFEDGIMKYSDNQNMAYTPLYEILKKENLMQFTGLKDKNGKEIYEGDILLHPQYEDRKCVVMFADAAFGVKGEGISQYLCYINEKTEVLENIYENPNLL